MENHFSFLSWNLALLNRSAHAPQHWELCDTEEVVREQVIELSPDIVLFQELTQEHMTLGRANNRERLFF